MAGTPPPAKKKIDQVCAIPFRYKKGRLQLCVITAYKKKRWIFPKGIIEPDETREQAALKEAFEEGGLHGRIVGKPLGKYSDTKWRQNIDVTVVLMEVTATERQWPEIDARQRRWVTPAGAGKLLGHAAMKRFAEDAVLLLTADTPDTNSPGADSPTDDYAEEDNETVEISSAGQG